MYLMCLAYPGKIKKINKATGVVDFDGVEKEVNLSLVPSVIKGDFVIVHAGFAIQKLSKREARDVIGDFKKIDHGN